MYPSGPSQMRITDAGSWILESMEHGLVKKHFSTENRLLPILVMQYKAH